MPTQLRRKQQGNGSNSGTQLVTRAYKKRGFIVDCIVSDNDSSMKSLLLHCYNECKAKQDAGDPKFASWTRLRKKNKAGVLKPLKGVGKLNLDVPEPRWLADLSHRTKVVLKKIFKLASQSKKANCGCTWCDAILLKKYWGYTIK